MRTKGLIIGLSFCCLVGCFFLITEEPVIKLSHSSGLIFSHAAHAEELTCLECHKGAKDRAIAGIPGKNSCNECHEEADHSRKENEGCYMCHTKPIKKPVWKKPEIYADVIFNHAKHVKSEKDCASCHGDVAKAAILSNVHLPGKEAVCLKCHQKDVESADRCSICHTETRMKRKPSDHDRAWKRFHGDAVEEDFFDKEWYRCAYCHEEKYCNACHKQEAPRGHNETWRRRTHGLHAEVDRMRCKVCHREDECVRCHATAPPYPRDAMHTGAAGCAGVCHKTAHGFGGQACTSCHK